MRLIKLTISLAVLAALGACTDGHGKTQAAKLTASTAAASSGQ